MFMSIEKYGLRITKFLAVFFIFALLIGSAACEVCFAQVAESKAQDSSKVGGAVGSNSGGSELGAVETTSNNGRFTKYSSGVFVDSSSGLEWYASPNEDYTWTRAANWISSLDVADGGWRMPTRSELAGLKADRFRCPQKNHRCTEIDSEGECIKTEYDGKIRTYDCYRPGVIDWPLVCGFVWSGEARDSTTMWLFGFYGGGVESWNGPDESNGDGRVVAVRAHRSDRFTKDSHDIITDKQTGLQWYMRPGSDISWPQAKSWAKNLRVGGGGWRMPTSNDLEKLVGPKQPDGISYLDPFFSQKGKFIWVWVGEIRHSPSAWFFSFRDGEDNWRFSRTRDYYARAFAVRSR